MHSITGPFGIIDCAIYFQISRAVSHVHAATRKSRNKQTNQPTKLEILYYLMVSEINPSLGDGRRDPRARDWGKYETE